MSAICFELTVRLSDLCKYVCTQTLREYSKTVSNIINHHVATNDWLISQEFQ